VCPDLLPLVALSRQYLDVVSEQPPDGSVVAPPLPGATADRAQLATGRFSWRGEVKDGGAAGGHAGGTGASLKTQWTFFFFLFLNYTSSAGQPVGYKSGLLMQHLKSRLLRFITL
jgi:hypothetical protein